MLNNLAHFARLSSSQILLTNWNGFCQEKWIYRLPSIPRNTLNIMMGMGTHFLIQFHNIWHQNHIKLCCCDSVFVEEINVEGIFILCFNLFLVLLVVFLVLKSIPLVSIMWTNWAEALVISSDLWLILMISWLKLIVTLHTIVLHHLLNQCKRDVR